MDIVNSTLNVGTGGKATTSPMVNLDYGHMNGFVPHLTREFNGKYFEEYFANEAHISQDIIPFVIRTPKIFDILQDETLGKKLKNHFINVMTIAPKTITGLKRTLSYEVGEHAIAGGQIHQQVVDAKRERSEPVHSYVEKKGKAIERLFTFIMHYGAMDYESKSNIMDTLQLKAGYVEKGKILSNEYFSCVMLYVEPDIWRKNVVEAYLCGNMFPMTFPENSSKMDKNSAKAIAEFDTSFTSIDRSNEAIRISAQYALDNLSIFSTNSDAIPGFINNTDITRALGETFGFHEESWK